MQTIKIQNCTEYRDSMLKVFVNDEKHIVSYQFNKVQVDSDKPFKIRTKYIWGGSREYTFEPKDNMTLQILHNQRMSKWSEALLITAMILNIGQMLLLKEFSDFVRGFVLSICVLFLIAPVVIRKKNTFIIREVNSNES